MSGKPQKTKILNKILKSPELSESQRYQDLLKYLVNAAINNQEIKETSIAIDLFGKNPEFNPIEDPIVRVYVSNLRKKLDHYYLTSGKEDEYKLVIPRGHYHVEFIPQKEKAEVSKKNLKKTLLKISIPLNVILILGIAFLLFNRSANKQTILKHDNPIWKEFIQKNENPTLLVYGDAFFLYEREENRERGFFVRDPLINTREDLKQALKKNPFLIKRYVELDFTYLRTSSIWGTVELFPMLWNAPNQIFLKLASETVLDDLNRNNTIFIGSFVTLHNLKDILFPSFKCEYKTTPRRLEFYDMQDGVKTVKKTIMPDETNQIDYSLIIKCQGPGNNIILLVMGFNEVSIIEGVKILLDPDLPQKLTTEKYKVNPNQPFFFKIILKVEGGRTSNIALDKEIIFFQQLNE